jgi:FHA domain/WXG100 protein secretion system (Wss), protein YukD
MKFHIQTPDAVVRPVEFPTDLPVEVLLRELVTDEGLKIQPPNPEVWHLFNENSGQKLDPKKNLDQNGVSGGQRLQLLRHVPAPGPVDSAPQSPGGEAMRRCDNGHYYDPKKHTKCPYCGVADIDVRSPRSIKIGPAVEEDSRTRPQGQRVGPTNLGVGDDAATRVILPGGTTAIDPVVGWFVSVHGPEKGRDYRIRSENNTIGRSKDMYICISGDESISRERHAVITFDPQRNAFHLGPGEGRGLVYVNGEVLLAHRELKPYDQIQLGKTKLIFVPFCGDRFAWGKDDE